MSDSGNAAQTVPASTLEMHEFCSRFEASILLRSGLETFGDGCKVSEYAEETAPAYWERPAFRRLGPEICAQSDMRHWNGI